MAFDGYHKWLGIPPAEQPPNHYRLLGIALFETDPDVIDASANRQMAYVQSCATGDNATLSQRILNELAAARICLLDAGKKATYDAELRAKQTAAVPVQAAATVLHPQVVPPQVGFQAPQAKSSNPPLSRSSIHYQPRRRHVGSFARFVFILCVALGGVGGIYVGLKIVNSWNSEDLLVVDGSHTKSSQDAEVAAQTTSTAPKPSAVKVPLTPPVTIPAPQQPTPSPTPASVPPKPTSTPPALAVVTPVPEMKTNPGSISAGNAPPLAVAPFDAAQAKAHQEAWAKHLGTAVETTNSVAAKLILIPPGEFLMGSPDSDSDSEDDEQPQHLVRITNPFYLCQTEVTQGQWQAVMGTEPWKGRLDIREGQNYAAAYVSWDDAVAFCRNLSEKEGKTYRLPTEAQWEYACRAGTTTRFHFGDDKSQLGDYAWYRENTRQRGDSYAHLVGQRKPNAWGLYDLHGNVWEWCSDWHGAYGESPASDPTGPAKGSHRVFRGGCWDYTSSFCRSAYRFRFSTDFQYFNLGFRVLVVSNVTPSAAATSQVPTSLVTAKPAQAAPTSPATSSTAMPLLTVAPFDAAQAKAHQAAWAKHLGTTVAVTNGIGAKLVLIPPGEFMMGSPIEEAERNDNETPHRVRITEPFFLGSTEVTQGQWKVVMGTEPWKGAKVSWAAEWGPEPSWASVNGGVRNGNDYPATYVSWEDAADFCKKLSIKEGKEYRLPTEAQWEYACRAGTTTRYSFGDDASRLSDYAWFDKNALAIQAEFAHLVGLKRPNPWGLYDLHGNAFEWCSDWYGDYEVLQVEDPSGTATGSDHVIRSGTWFNAAWACRSAFRHKGLPSPRYFDLGFRCVQTLNAPVETANVTPQTVPPVVTPTAIQVPRTEAARKSAFVEPAALAGRMMKEELLREMGGSDQTEQSVEAGLLWLANHQLSNGLWSMTGAAQGGKGNFSKGADFENQEAATGMALLAFLGAGHTIANNGPYAKVVKKGVDALIRGQDNTGRLFHGPQKDDLLYTQAICTTALCECLALNPTYPQLRARCQKAVDFCLATQSETGGWKYTPRLDSDTSVTGWMLMALQSAKAVKLKVPEEAFGMITKYLDTVATRLGNGQQIISGSRYGYMIGDNFDHVMTAEGLLSRMYLGWNPSDERLRAGCDYLLKEKPPEWPERDMYYWYHATQLMFHMEGQYWRTWNGKYRDMLVNNQEKDGIEKGSWNPMGTGKDEEIGADTWSLVKRGGRLYVTCLSICMLEAYYRHLPLYSDLKKQLDARK